jgi:hypothetical protein
MSFTNFAARRVLNSWIGGATPQSPNYSALTGNIPTHIGYHIGVSAPAETGAGFTEPVGNGYARFPLPGGTGNGFTIATDADPSLIENSSAVTFAAASGGNHGDVTHIGFFDAASGGNLLFILALTATRTINDGEALSFNAGELELTLD